MPRGLLSLACPAANRGTLNCWGRKTASSANYTSNSMGTFARRNLLAGPIRNGLMNSAALSDRLAMMHSFSRHVDALGALRMNQRQ